MDQLTDKHALWLEDRKIPAELAAEYGLYSTDKGALGIPYYVDGKLIMTKFRGGPDSKTFWIAPKGVPVMPLWNFDSLRQNGSETLIVTEGEMDALAWLVVGASAVVSLPNGGSATLGDGPIDRSNDGRFACLWSGSKLHPEIAKFKRIILSVDNDDTGKVLGTELAIRIGRDVCWFVTYPEGCKDANDVLMKHGDEGLDALVKGAKPLVPRRLVKFSDIPMDNRETYELGWAGLEDHIKLRPPELVVLTGLAGSGKSQFALNIGANLARLHGLRGTLMQFEDHPERNRDDLLRYASAWQIPHAEEWVDKMFRTIAPPEVTGADDRFTLEWLTDTIREAVRIHDSKWICIDPWNEVEHLWGGSENETAYTNRALAQMKALARLLQIVLIIVTHPGKAAAVKGSVDELTLYDVSGSAAWRNKADHGVILMRNPTALSEVWVKVDKSKDHRRMGYPGTVRMRFNPRHASYEFIAKGV